VDRGDNANVPQRQLAGRRQVQLLVPKSSLDEAVGDLARGSDVVTVYAVRVHGGCEREGTIALVAGAQLAVANFQCTRRVFVTAVLVAIGDRTHHVQTQGGLGLRVGHLENRRVARCTDDLKGGDALYLGPIIENENATPYCS